ncbi:hypothetical protein Bca4012_103619 [Brassica carinata]
MKRTLKRESRVLEIVGRKRMGRRCVGRMRAEQSGPPDRSGAWTGGLKRWPKPGFITPAERRCLVVVCSTRLTACLGICVLGRRPVGSPFDPILTGALPTDLDLTRRVECEHACRDRKMVNYAWRGEAERNSGGGRSDTDGGVAALLSHPRNRSSKWAIFGKQSWRCGMNRKRVHGAQLRANLEPTKGVGRLRQQGGGHGSRNPLRVCNNSPAESTSPKMDGAEARDLYRPSGQEPGLDE